MPRHLGLIHLGTDHVGDLTSTIRLTTAGLTRAFSLSQAMDELFAQLPNRQRIDGGVNCLATDVGVFKFRLVHVSQLAGDLLWRQVAPKKVLNKPEPLAIDG